MFCTNCRAELEDRDKFCWNCGHLVRGMGSADSSGEYEVCTIRHKDVIPAFTVQIIAEAGDTVIAQSPAVATLRSAAIVAAQRKLTEELMSQGWEPATHDQAGQPVVLRRLKRP